MASPSEVLASSPENIRVVAEAIDGASLMPQDMEIQNQIWASLNAAAERVLAALKAREVALLKRG